MIPENLLKCLPEACQYKLIKSHVGRVVVSVAEW